jgi:ribosomal protein S18 acetylase RimI-like enzyme
MTEPVLNAGGAALQIEGPRLDAVDDCTRILRTLPMWFGIEESLLEYARNTAQLPTFSVHRGERRLGFLSLREHFQTSWEIDCIGVDIEARNEGLGKALLAHAEAWLRTRQARVLQVKTIAATSPNPHYALTRKFYEGQGFIPHEIFPELWSASNPCLQMIKIL